VAAGTLVAGRYRLLRPLGQGGMAAVELAEDVELGRTVAVKLLRDGLADDADVRRRFLREARLAGGVAHPNVVRVYDAGEHEDRPYFVMEYVEGETLEDVVGHEGRLAAPRAVELLLQACAGIQAAHEKGLVHRDVKPQNLLLRTDGVLKVVDFGIARAQDGTQLTEAGTVLGSAGYMSPEQLAGGEVTAAADVYGLGAVLYDLLTGRPPRAPGRLAEVSVDEPITAPRDLVRSIPPSLERTIMRCLARSPEARPGSAAALARELEATAPGSPTRPRATRAPLDAPARTTNPPRTAAITRFRRRPVALLVAVAALAVALAAGLALGLALRGGDAGPGGSALPPRPAAIPPVPHSDDPAQQARNLSAWIRRHAAARP
jgi:serine/threonine protein kinase